MTPLVLATIASPLLWAGFVTLILALLALDLGVFHRKAHAVSLKEAAAWSAVWVGLAAVFGVFVWRVFGPERGLEFAAGYLIEKALSVDNLFVFVVIFSYFAVAPRHQHRLLFWGILGALVLRGIFVILGGAFLERFHWAIYVFGGLLVVTGVKLLLQRHSEIHPERNPVVRIYRRFLPVATDAPEGRLFVVQGGRRIATTLFVALLTIEATDVVFAVDSIPAVFAVTNDSFIVYTSNVFAILGLRSLYFLLAGVLDKFRYLKVGLAFVLMFVGLKMGLSDVWHVPVGISLGVVAGLLGASVAASMLLPVPDGEDRPLSPAAQAGPIGVPPEHNPVRSGSLEP